MTLTREIKVKEGGGGPESKGMGAIARQTGEGKEKRKKKGDYLS